MSTVIHVPLPDDAPLEAEAVAARPLGDDLYEILAAPLVTYDLHKGDRVRCHPGEPPVFSEVVKHRGHRTVRLLLDPDLGGLDRMKVLLGLKEAGLVAEEPRGRYLALDAPPRVDLDAVAALLDAHAEAGLLDFEIVQPG